VSWLLRVEVSESAAEPLLANLPCFSPTLHRPKLELVELSKLELVVALWWRPGALLVQLAATW